MGLFDRFRAKAPPAPTQRADGWVNNVTGQGLETRDKTVNGRYDFSPILWDGEITALFNNNDLAYKIIAKPVKEMFRKGWTSDAGVAAEKRARELGIDDRLAEAATSARTYGGAGIFLGCPDGKPETPLRDTVAGIDFLHVLDRRYLLPASWDSNPRSPGFGKPLLWRITPPFSGTFESLQGHLVHTSRILAFDGEPCDIQTRVTRQGWGLSVLQRVYDVLRKHDCSWDAAAALVTDFAQAVFKIKNLMEAMSSNNGAKFLARMQLADMTRSALRAMVIDADGESFERTQTPMTGLPDMLDRFMMRLAAAADMPASILFGRAPAGMNATGDMDVRMWYDSVASDRQKRVQPQHERILSLLAKKPVAVTYPPLWERTEQEIAQEASTWATADASNVNAGIVTPEEVALSRWDDEGCIRPGMEALDRAGRETAMVAHPYDLQAEQKGALAAAAVEGATNPEQAAGGDGTPATATTTE